MIWLGAHRGYLSDWVTQQWVRATGRRVDLDHAPWLRGPTGTTDRIGADFFEQYAARAGGDIVQTVGPQGLVPSLSDIVLGAPVDSSVAAFYERTSEYDMDCWSEWSTMFRPFGRLLAILFSRRLEQLNVPLTGLDTHRGISSRVLRLRYADGTLETAWVRELLASRRTLYAGSYSVCRVPGYEGFCIRVCFPLPNGRAMVIMRPEIHADGSLTVISDGRRFGDPGFYFVVESAGCVWAKYVATMKETIHVYPSEGLVRADHVLRIWGATFLRLHYRLSEKTSVR